MPHDFNQMFMNLSPEKGLLIRSIVKDMRPVVIPPINNAKTIFFFIRFLFQIGLNGLFEVTEKNLEILKLKFYIA